MSASRSGLEISAVIPAKNEAENLPELIAEIHKALAGRDYEVVVVDDGSTDNTPQLLADLARSDPRLVHVRHASSLGRSAAVYTATRKARGDRIVTLDGDGQNDPADIPALVEIALAAEGRSGARIDLVTGIRRKRQDTWLRRMSSRVANNIRQRMLKDGVRDTGCGLKVMRRDAFLRLPYFDHMHRYYPALILRGGGEIRCVDVNHRPRMRGTSNYGLFDRLWVGITDLFGVAWLIKRAKRPVIEPDA